MKMPLLITVAALALLPAWTGSTVAFAQATGDSPATPPAPETNLPASEVKKSGQAQPAERIPEAQSRPRPGPRPLHRELGPNQPPSRPLDPNPLRELQRLERELDVMEKTTEETVDEMERAELREHLLLLRKQADQLSKTGRTEEAQKIERQAHDAIAKLRAANRTRRVEARPGPRPQPPMNAESRLRHLRSAVENLRAAGLHEPADELSRQADHLQHELESTAQPKPAGAHPEELAGAVRALQSEVLDLRQAVRDLARQVEELRRR